MLEVCLPQRGKARLESMYDSNACALFTRPIIMQRQRSMFFPTQKVEMKQQALCSGGQFRALSAAEVHVYCLICWLSWCGPAAVPTAPPALARSPPSTSQSPGPEMSAFLSKGCQFLPHSTCIVSKRQMRFQFFFVCSSFSLQVLFVFGFWFVLALPSFISTFLFLICQTC